jgi:hypothetical protein
LIEPIGKLALAIATLPFNAKTPSRRVAARRSLVERLVDEGVDAADKKLATLATLCGSPPLATRSSRPEM